MFRIAAEVVLGFLALVAASAFWSVRKRDNYMRKTVLDARSLSHFIGYVRQSGFFDIRDNISRNQAMWTDDYGRNMLLELKADASASKRMQAVTAIVLLVVMILSFVLNWLFLVINLGISLFPVLFPVSTSAKGNALGALGAVAWNLRKFYEKDPGACERFIDDAAPALKPLFMALVGEGVLSRR